MRNSDVLFTYDKHSISLPPPSLLGPISSPSLLFPITAVPLNPCCAPPYPTQIMSDMYTRSNPCPFPDTPPSHTLSFYCDVSISFFFIFPVPLPDLNLFPFLFIPSFYPSILPSLIFSPSICLSLQTTSILLPVSKDENTTHQIP